MGIQSQKIMLLELEKRFSANGIRKQRWVYLRNRLFWHVVITSAKIVKRTIDIVVSAVALVVLTPLFIIVAAAIKLEDPEGGVLYWQIRVGKWGREFPFPKFRSMVANAAELKDALLAQNDHKDSITFKMKDDPRITRVGRFIRRFSIDELPQFWCVLVGDMSLVGPRPAIQREVAEYTIKDRCRLEVTPGLTCIWQVSGRGDIPFDQQVRLDEEYILSQSLWVDLKLLLLTIPAILTGRGAY